MHTFHPSDVRSLDDAFWAALSDSSIAADRRALLSRLLSSPELHAIRTGWKDARVRLAAFTTVMVFLRKGR